MVVLFLHVEKLHFFFFYRNQAINIEDFKYIWFLSKIVFFFQSFCNLGNCSIFIPTLFSYSLPYLATLTYFLSALTLDYQMSTNLPWLFNTVAIKIISFEIYCFAQLHGKSNNIIILVSLIANVLTVLVFKKIINNGDSSW